MKRLSRWRVFVFAGLVLFPSDGSTQAPYYAGKTITVIEGNSAGGTADLRTKSIVQFCKSTFREIRRSLHNMFREEGADRRPIRYIAQPRTD